MQELLRPRNYYLNLSHYYWFLKTLPVPRNSKQWSFLNYYIVFPIAPSEIEKTFSSYWLKKENE